MALHLITPATDLLVSVADAKAHLRVDLSDEDALIQAYIDAATQHAEHVTDRAFLSQTWRLSLPRFRSEIRVPKPPLQSVTSLKYVASDGTLTTLVEGTDFEAFIESGSTFGTIRPAYGLSWPSVRSQPDAVQLTFVAGWASVSDVPDNIVAAVRLLVGDLYENRENANAANLKTIPIAAERLLAAHRVYSFGTQND